MTHGGAPVEMLSPGDWGDGVYLLDDGALAVDDGLGAMSFVMPYDGDDIPDVTCDALLVNEDPLPYLTLR